MRSIIAAVILMLPSAALANEALSCNQAVRRLLQVVNIDVAAILASQPTVRNDGELGYRLTWSLPSDTELAVNCSNETGTTAITVYRNGMSAESANLFRAMSVSALCAISSSSTGQCAELFDQAARRSIRLPARQVFAKIGSKVSIIYENFSNDMQKLMIMPKSWSAPMSAEREPLALVWVNNDGDPIP